MPTVTTTDIERYIRTGNFEEYFVEELNWDFADGYDPYPIEITQSGSDAISEVYTLHPVVEKRGIVLFSCGPSENGTFPAPTERRRIDRKLTDYAHEHLIVFHDDTWKHQIWQYTDREPGKPLRPRTVEMHPGQSGEAVRQLLSRLAFDVDEDEDEVTLVDVLNRIKAGIPADNVTRKFYKEFSKQRDTFEKFIEGIEAQGDREWYASIMLNRLMFIWFVQAKGFLDNDPNYLANRFDTITRRHPGDGTAFMSFYRAFLRKLFDEGLDTPKELRDPEIVALLGDVPYLNGGIFDRHELERANEIDIPDKAFANLFAFFGQYHWHLDSRPLRNDREINPDVIGYIFEQFVNKEKGAYYTKEDVTGYISQNTIIPWILEQARKECAIAFRPDAADNVWTLLHRDPDRYIYPAMKHGVIDPDGTVFEVPEMVAPGIDDVSQRGNWNQRADEPYALPTETWREYVHRRRRTLELQNKLASGGVHEVDDLITYNLDIRQFAQDIVEQFDDPALLRAMYKAIAGITVLDPTCGSGAFLFAALEILHPLHDACLDKMAELVADLPTEADPKRMRDFRERLAEMERHPNKNYFVQRQIVLNNLYGVDIEEEAVEICKIRLFLSMVAKLENASQIEPLPDIDFNIRAGNTLVGYATINEIRSEFAGQTDLDLFDEHGEIQRELHAADLAHRRFMEFQKSNAVAVQSPQQYKQEYRQRLDSLANVLDHKLAKVQRGTSIREWKNRVHPFHWISEFHWILASQDGNGGFDVVIGNPPYVETSKVNGYSVDSYATRDAGNLYAHIFERTHTLASKTSIVGMIVPLSGHSTPRMRPLINHVYRRFHQIWLTNLSGDANPSTLFEGVKFRLAVAIGWQPKKQLKSLHTTGYLKWFTEARDQLFEIIEYASDVQHDLEVLPKIATSVEAQLLETLLSSKSQKVGHIPAGTCVTYYHNAPVSWVRAHTFVPYFHSERDGQKISTQLKPIRSQSQDIALALSATINSTLFYFWWTALSDCYHVTKSNVDPFYFPLNDPNTIRHLSRLGKQLEQDLQKNSRRRVYNYKSSGRVEYDEYYPKLSKEIIDEIDAVLIRSLGLGSYILDYLTSYMFKFRMGRDAIA